jgi:hypothetical protein
LPGHYILVNAANHFPYIPAFHLYLQTMDKNTLLFYGAGVAIGAGIGLAINNLAIGMGVGAALGLAFARNYRRRSREK